MYFRLRLRRLRLRFTGVNAVSGEAVVYPLTIVPATVCPGELSLTIFLIILEIAVVCAAVWEGVDPFPVAFPSFPSASVLRLFVWPSVRPATLNDVTKELAPVNVAAQICHSAVSVTFVVFPVSVIDAAILVAHLSFTFLQAAAPLSLVPRLAWPSELSVAVRAIILEVAFVE